MKHLRIQAALVVVLSSIAVSATGQVVNGLMVGDWYVSEVRSRVFPLPECWASHSQFSDGTTMKLTISPRQGSISGMLSLENADWVSLPSLSASDADRRLNIRLVFEGTDEVHEAEFVGSRGSPEYGTKPKLYRRFETAELGTIMRGISRSEAMRVERDGRVIGRYPMNGSSAAMDEALACVNRVFGDAARRANNDPFRD